MKKFGLYVLAFLVAIQLYRPEQTNPPVDESKALAATPEVAATFKRACADCHSNNTIWPWYSKISPLSLVITHDVDEGREHLNFSKWADYNARDKGRALEHICKEVSSGDMPPSQYTLLHSDAKLSDQEKKSICDWANTTLKTP